MKRFLVKITTFILFFLLIVILLTFFGRLLNNHESNFKVPQKYTSIILGHSHSECAYNVAKIQSFRNYSQSGEAYFYTYIKSRKILNSNKHIKNVFIEFSNNQICSEMDDWIFGNYFISHFYPLYSSIMTVSDFRYFFSENPMGLLNSQGKSVIQNIFYSATSGQFLDRLGGYLPLPYSNGKSFIKNAHKEKKYLPLKISKSNLNFLDSIISLFKTNNVNVYLIRSPLHANYPGLNNEHQFQKILHTRLNGVNFLDFKDFPLRDDQYEDYEHLNEEGAKDFSEFFNRIVENGLLDKTCQQCYITKNIDSLKRKLLLDNKSK